MPRLAKRDGAVWGEIYVAPLHRSDWGQRKERSYSVQLLNTSASEDAWSFGRAEGRIVKGLGKVRVRAVISPNNTLIALSCLITSESSNFWRAAISSRSRGIGFGKIGLLVLRKAPGHQQLC